MYTELERLPSFSLVEADANAANSIFRNDVGLRGLTWVLQDRLVTLTKPTGL